MPDFMSMSDPVGIIPTSTSVNFNDISEPIGNQPIAAPVASGAVPAPTFADVPEDRTGTGYGSTIGAFGKTLLEVPLQVPAKIIQAVKGQSGASVTDKDIFNRYVDWTDERARKLSEEYNGSGDFIPGLISKQDVAELGPNVAFSLANAATAVPAGMAATSVTGPVGGYAAGMATAGGVSYRMDSYMAMQDWLNKKNEESLAKTGKPIDPKEEAAFKEQFSKFATDHGLWEAGPEAIGSGLEYALAFTPAKNMAKILPKRLTGKVSTAVARALGVLATEQTTETITQMGQQRAEAGAGMSENGEPARQWGDPSAWAKSGKEVLPQVLLLSGLMSGVGGVSRMVGGKEKEDNVDINVAPTEATAPEATSAVPTVASNNVPYDEYIKKVRADKVAAEKLSTEQDKTFAQQELRTTEEWAMRNINLDPGDPGYVPATKEHKDYLAGVLTKAGVSYKTIEKQYPGISTWLNERQPTPVAAPAATTPVGTPTDVVSVKPTDAFEEDTIDATKAEYSPVGGERTAVPNIYAPDMSKKQEVLDMIGGVQKDVTTSSPTKPIVDSGASSKVEPLKTDEQYTSDAKNLGIKFNGIQEGAGKIPSFPFFTDNVTGTTFTMEKGESLELALARKRKQFKDAEEKASAPTGEQLAKQTERANHVMDAVASSPGNFKGMDEKAIKGRIKEALTTDITKDVTKTTLTNLESSVVVTMKPGRQLDQLAKFVLDAHDEYVASGRKKLLPITSEMSPSKRRIRSTINEMVEIDFGKRGNIKSLGELKLAIQRKLARPDVVKKDTSVIGKVKREGLKGLPVTENVDAIVDKIHAMLPKTEPVEKTGKVGLSKDELIASEPAQTPEQALAVKEAADARKAKLQEKNKIDLEKARIKQTVIQKDTETAKAKRGRKAADLSKVETIKEKQTKIAETETFSTSTRLQQRNEEERSRLKEKAIALMSLVTKMKASDVKLSERQLKMSKKEQARIRQQTLTVATRERKLLEDRGAEIAAGQGIKKPSQDVKIALAVQEKTGWFFSKKDKKVEWTFNENVGKVSKETKVESIEPVVVSEQFVPIEPYQWQIEQENRINELFSATYGKVAYGEEKEKILAMREELKDLLKKQSLNHSIAYPKISSDRRIHSAKSYKRAHFISLVEQLKLDPSKADSILAKMKQLEEEVATEILLEPKYKKLKNRDNYRVEIEKRISALEDGSIKPTMKNYSGLAAMVDKILGPAKEGEYRPGNIWILKQKQQIMERVDIASNVNANNFLNQVMGYIGRKESADRTAKMKWLGKILATYAQIKLDQGFSTRSPESIKRLIGMHEGWNLMREVDREYARMLREQEYEAQGLTSAPGAAKVVSKEEVEQSYKQAGVIEHTIRAIFAQRFTHPEIEGSFYKELMSFKNDQWRTSKLAIESEKKETNANLERIVKATDTKLKVINQISEAIDDNFIGEVRKQVREKLASTGVTFTNLGLQKEKSKKTIMNIVKSWMEDADTASKVKASVGKPKGLLDKVVADLVTAGEYIASGEGSSVKSVIKDVGKVVAAMESTNEESGEISNVGVTSGSSFEKTTGRKETQAMNTLTARLATLEQGMQNGKLTEAEIDEYMKLSTKYAGLYDSELGIDKDAFNRPEFMSKMTSKPYAYRVMEASKKTGEELFNEIGSVTAGRLQGTTAEGTPKPSFEKFSKTRKRVVQSGYLYDQLKADPDMANSANRDSHLKALQFFRGLKTSRTDPNVVKQTKRYFDIIMKYYVYGLDKAAENRLLDYITQKSEVKLTQSGITGKRVLAALRMINEGKNTLTMGKWQVNKDRYGSVTFERAMDSAFTNGLGAEFSMNINDMIANPDQYVGSVSQGTWGRSDKIATRINKNGVRLLIIEDANGTKTLRMDPDNVKFRINQLENADKWTSGMASISRDPMVAYRDRQHNVVLSVEMIKKAMPTAEVLQPAKDTFEVIFPNGWGFKLVNGKLEQVYNEKGESEGWRKGSWTITENDLKEGIPLMMVAKMSDAIMVGETLHHEVFHMVTDIFMTKSEQKAMLDQYREEGDTERDTWERAARVYEAWAPADTTNASATIFERILGYAREFLAAIKGFFNVSPQMTSDAFFDEIRSGRIFDRHPMLNITEEAGRAFKLEQRAMNLPVLRVNGKVSTLEGINNTSAWDSVVLADPNIKAKQEAIARLIEEGKVDPKTLPGSVLRAIQAADSYRATGQSWMQAIADHLTRISDEKKANLSLQPSWFQSQVVLPHWLANILTSDKRAMIVEKDAKGRLKSRRNDDGRKTYRYPWHNLAAAIMDNKYKNDTNAQFSYNELNKTWEAMPEKTKQALYPILHWGDINGEYLATDKPGVGLRSSKQLKRMYEWAGVKGPEVLSEGQIKAYGEITSYMEKVMLPYIQKSIEIGYLYPYHAAVDSQVFVELQDLYYKLLNGKAPSESTLKAAFANPALTKDQQASLKKAYNSLSGRISEMSKLRAEIGSIKGYMPRYHGEGDYYAAAVRYWDSGKVDSKGNKIESHENVDSRNFHTLAEANRYAALLAKEERFQNTPGSRWRFYSDRAGKLGDEEFFLTSDFNMEHIMQVAINKARAKGEIDVDVAEKISSEVLEQMANIKKERGASRSSIARKVLEWDKQNYATGYNTDQYSKDLKRYVYGHIGSRSKLESHIKFLEVIQTIPNNMKDTASQIRDYMENSLRNPEKMDRIVGGLKSFAFNMLLLGKASLAILQVTQNFITAIPMLAAEMNATTSKKYNKLDAEKFYTTAMKDVVADHMGKQRTDLIKKDEREMLDYERKHGYLYARMTRDLQMQAAATGVKWVMKTQDILAFPMAGMEIYNRQVAALAYYRFLKANPKNATLSAEEIYDKVGTFINSTHYWYGRGNLPPAMAGGNTFSRMANLAYTFGPFPHNYANSMWYVQQSYGGPAAAAFAARSFAYLMLFAGVPALPFLDDFLEKIESITGVPYRQEAKAKIRDTGGPLGERLYNAGLLSLMGIDAAGALRPNLPMAGLMPFTDDSESVFGVFGGYKKDLGKASEEAKRGDYLRAVEYVSPTVIKNAMKAYRVSTRGLTSSSTERPYFDENLEPVTGTPWEAALQVASFKPYRTGQIMEDRWHLQNVEKTWSERANRIREMFALAENTEDYVKAIEAKNKYNESIPDVLQGVVAPMVNPKEARPDKRDMRFKMNLGLM